MISRVALVLLQLVGALSIVPYPAILLANVMSMAGEGPRGGQRILLVVGYGLLSLYPLVWVALYVLAWRAMGRGATVRAFAFSIVPAAATLAGVGVLFANTGSVNEIQRVEANREKAQVEGANPLVWSILCAEGSHRLPGVSSVPIETAVNAIDRSDRLNDPAPVYGTPLQTALANLRYTFDGTPSDSGQKGLERLVRALLARGAGLSPRESENLENLWRLKRVAFEGPIITRTENPLVWRVLQLADPRGPYMRNGEIPALGTEERPLLNKSTLLHGTPLGAALRLGAGRGTRMVEALIYAGAKLSPEEMATPAFAASLHKLFDERPDLRTVYRR